MRVRSMIVARPDATVGRRTDDERSPRRQLRQRSAL
ncbi:hypothetical protein Ae406Ps2_1028 [Pseudonocardia sp. Ae406_Ps2]|nr:hypothetical protein Ae406Ps2_1028 [Pseudonocardia sp. Ae406_Ps2]OLM07177.1 hypothetical protein Ae331Ps2_4887c [Pseudonocardia sp. Ae331_Ps2]OLM14371.1 hypothetical protein Ae505Ps2_4501c [Pseudonocardia sp. Ae505_Ps2]OLM22606.1 hypothetical protein Ae706Ps2_1038 [Pseudonocardia sp. Ae706_Ps2]